MRVAPLSGLVSALGVALAMAGASCAPRARIPAVDPAVRDTMLVCAAQEASGQGFVIVMNADHSPDRLEMLRVARVTSTSAGIDAFEITVTRSDSASPPQLQIRAFSAVSRTERLPPRPELVALAGSISARCKDAAPPMSGRRFRLP